MCLYMNDELVDAKWQARQVHELGMLWDYPPPPILFQFHTVSISPPEIQMLKYRQIIVCNIIFG